MSAPRVLDFGHPRRPAQATDAARLTRARAYRALPEPARLAMRRASARPSAVITATNPMKPHGADVPFQMVTLAHEAHAPCSAALAYWKAGVVWTMALYRSALRSGCTMLRETQQARADCEASLMAALSDGVFTAAEKRACAERVLYVVATHEELAATLAAEADRQERDGPTGGRAA